MWNKNFFFSFFIFHFFSCAQAQDSLEANKNAIFGEFFGNAQTIGSANYERIFQSKRKSYVCYSAGSGIGIQGSQYDDNTFFSFPFELGIFIGSKHNLETSLGCTFFFGTSDLNDPRIPLGYKTNFNYNYSFRLGYRFITDDGLLFRLAPLLLITKVPPEGNCFKLQPIFGFSLGKVW